MNNAIVYSFHFESQDPNSSPSGGQLCYSIHTLRQHNKEIPVKVFISPPDAYSKLGRGLEDVEVIEFDASTETLLEDIAMATRRKHRWPNAYLVLKTDKYDNVLYVDPDTVWQDDPQKIFTKYGNNDVVCSKEESWEEFTDFLKLNTPPMNEGVMMIPRSALNYKDQLLAGVESTMLKWQEELRPTLESNRHLWYAGVQWAACQYALSEFLFSIKKAFINFEDKDVVMIQKYRHMSNEEKEAVIVLHYLSQNYAEFVPSEFLNYWRPDND